MSADEIATKAMGIAADLCVYSNHNTIKEVLVKENKEVQSGLRLCGE